MLTFFLIFLIFSTVTCKNQTVDKNEESTPSPNSESPKIDQKGGNSTKNSNSTSLKSTGPIKMPKGRSLRKTGEIPASVYETEAYGIPQLTQKGAYPFGQDRSPVRNVGGNEHRTNSYGDPYGDPVRHGQSYGHGQSGWYNNYRNRENRDGNYDEPYGTGYGQNGWDRNNYGNGWDRNNYGNGESVNSGWGNGNSGTGNSGWGNGISVTGNIGWGNGNSGTGNSGWGNGNSGSGNNGWGNSGWGNGNSGSGNSGWGNSGWGQNGWGQNGAVQNNHNPAKYYDTTGKGNSRNTAVYNYGCERDIIFGDQKWVLQGRDYCQNLECKYTGPKKTDNSTIINGVCNSVRVTNNTIGYQDYDVTFNIHCRCPEIGHTGLPLCERKVQIFFHLVPKKTYLDCVNNFDYCGEGKYCMTTSQQATCPTSCKIETDTFTGTTTIRTNYDCCVLV